MQTLGKYTSYYLLDKYYSSDSFTNGRKFKSFFDNFAKKLFEINLKIQKGIGDFPLVYNERMGYAGIAGALFSLTPYVESEVPFSCADSKKRITNAQGKEQNTRSVDFWCQLDKGDPLQIWIEHKLLWLNASKRANGEFDTACFDIIKNARKQIKDIKNLKCEGLKVATFCDNRVCKQRAHERGR
ncbi:hypothetical protein BKN38_01150 [Helicobacter sp. CLO-3]|uniref:hypothetical protein n=1 Tax=unclassified Helicobacter TaxID=2593540 RepID=UPI0008051DAF|nr:MULTISPECIES: hypothetical protein [unclassified Helicobacter]OBV28552.1 hypothetical protein BA723_08985 [Helicobacter sp. CLO-3]OHU85652.1 hypothetical protein BKN38_01150 [Helicobacter sp. CLO-3]